MPAYTQTAKSYNELHGSEQLKKINIVLENIKIKPKDKILDVGCGTGIFFEELERRRIKCSKFGIEPSKEMLKQCRAKAELKQGFAETLPYKDKTFDIITSITAIHNFKNIKKAIKEMKRVLKDKGRAAITALKKSAKAEEIKKELLNEFKLIKEIEEEKDSIFILQKKQKIKILICPKCKSDNITLDSGGITGKYVCKNCMYTGNLIIEKEV